MCELVDRSGRPTSAATVDWRHLNIADAFAGFAGFALESDVRAAGLAEARYGAGIGLEAFIYLVVGTGISYCLVLDGEPYTGARGNAILVGAPPVEERSSGLALARRGGVSRAEQVFADPRNVVIVASAAASLGEAIAWLVNALDPEIVVIGGGLGLDNAYRELVVAAARSAITANETKILPIVPSWPRECDGRDRRGACRCERARRPPDP